MNNFFLYLNHLKLISKLLILFPISLIAGPVTFEAIIFLSTIIFFIKADKNIIFKLLNKFPVKLFLIFWIYIIINSFFSFDPLISLKSSFFYIRFLFLAFCIYYALEYDKLFLKYFLIVLAACLVFLLIDSIIQYTSPIKTNLFGMVTPEPNDRLSSLFHNEMIMGSYVSRLIPLYCLAFFFLNKKLSYFIFFSGFILIFLSGERTALGMALIATSVILFICKFNFKKKLFFTFSIISIFLFLILTNKHYFNRNITLTINEIKNTSKKITDFQIFSPKHHSLYQTAYNIFLDNKILGMGAYSFRYVCDDKQYKYNENSCSTHPHNFPLQILSELGIIGFIIYLSTFGLIIFRIFFSKDNVLAKLVLTCFFINFFPFVPSGNLFNNWLSSMIYLPLGFYLYFNNPKNKV